MNTFKQAMLSTFLTSFLIPTEAIAADVTKTYMVDELPMVFRTGPRPDYRMIFGLNTGDEVEILAVNEENLTTQVKTIQGKVGWVETKYIVSFESAKTKLANLRKKFNTLKKANANNSKKEQQQKQQQNTLSENNLKLQRQVTELRNNLEVEQQKTLRLSDKKRNEPLIFGGGIALAGLLLGWILARSKPKRSNWN